jgi:hypothetical protein
MAADPRPKILALIEKRRELFEQSAAIDAEITRLLNGGEGIGAKLTRVKAFWCATWQERHREPFDFDHAKHTDFLKKKILAHGEESVTAKIANFILGEDAPAARARHPFGWFMQGYNTIKGLPSVPEPVHSSDKIKELRGV